MELLGDLALCISKRTKKGKGLACLARAQSQVQVAALLPHRCNEARRLCNGIQDCSLIRFGVCVGQTADV
jgi:hypothetical protein